MWVSQQPIPPLPQVSEDPNACDPGLADCLVPQQVFVDGAALALAPGSTPPGPGQFAIERSGIVLGEDPNGHLVEVTSRARWIVTAADGVTIQGLTMRDAGNSALIGAVSNDGHSNCTSTMVGSSFQYLGDFVMV